jgi:hypothetical protein
VFVDLAMEAQTNESTHMLCWMYSYICFGSGSMVGRVESKV